jgi:hypothetical protein
MVDSAKKNTSENTIKKLKTVAAFQDALGSKPIGFSSNDLPVVVRVMPKEMQIKSFKYNFHQK